MHDIIWVVVVRSSHEPTRYPMNRADAWVIPERYDGETNSSGQRHGNGTLYSSNGDIYMGEWQNGCRHGKGIQTYAWKLEKYEGDWLADEWNGHGCLTLVNGSYVEASFKDGRLHGISKLTSIDGVTVESAWVEGKMFTNDVRIVWPLLDDEKEPLR